MKFDLCGKFDLEVMLAVKFWAKVSWNDFVIELCVIMDDFV